MLAALSRRLQWRLNPPLLALGGGGARGFAHIGVLRVIDELGLKIKGIVGTSMGAVIGAMYLAHGSAGRVLELWREALERKLVPTIRPMRAVAGAGVRENPLTQVARRIRNRVVVSVAVNRRTMLEDLALREALAFLLPQMEVEELRPFFAAVATDLGDGSEVILRRGDLASVLRASSAIPGFLPAVELDGRLLVDGGVVAEVPVRAARSLNRRVVAVDVSMELPPLVDDRIALDTMMRTQLMTSTLLRQVQLAPFQPVVRPQVGETSWSDWTRLDDLIARGSDAMWAWLGMSAPQPSELEPPPAESTPASEA